MCIAIFKPIDVNPPSKKTFRNCFLNNPDGAGFCYTENGITHIHKGYFSFRKFYKASRNYVKTRHPAIYHFRFATSGWIDGGNCHPFPLSDKTAILRKEDLQTTNIVCAHNGMFYNVEDSIKISDTMSFIKNTLSDPVIKSNLFKNQAVQQLINDSIDPDKMIFLNSEGHYIIMGKFQKADGIYYSNNTYKWDGNFQTSYMPYNNGVGAINLQSMESSPEGVCTNCQKSPATYRPGWGEFLCDDCATYYFPKHESTPSSIPLTKPLEK